MSHCLDCVAACTFLHHTFERVLNIMEVVTSQFLLQVMVSLANQMRSEREVAHMCTMPIDLPAVL